MTSSSYAQFCAIARALDVVGERWSLLVMRELVIRGPRRFSDLRRGLPGIAPNVLSTRLKALTDRSLIRRRSLPPPAASEVYELTDLGARIEPVLVELARWGLHFMDAPRAEDIVELDWILAAVQAFAAPHVPLGVRETYEIRFEQGTVHIRVHDGALHAETGPADTPDLIIATDLATFIALGRGTTDIATATRDNRATITGSPDIAQRALEILTPKPTPTTHPNPG